MMLGTTLGPLNDCLYFDLPHHSISPESTDGFVSFAVSTTERNKVDGMYRELMKCVDEFIKTNCDDLTNVELEVTQEPSLVEYTKNGEVSVWEVRCTFRIRS